MTATSLFALGLPSTENVTEIVIRALAVAGAAALGFFGLGALTQLLARAMTTYSMPRLPLNIIRVLGAIAVGLLAWALLFRGGDSGSGGGGGLWPFGGGGGTGKGGEPAATQRDTPTNRGETPRDTSRAGPEERTALRVVVVGSNPVVYRMTGVDGSPALSLEKLKELLLERKKAMPPLQKLDIVVYKEDGPVPDGAPVTVLADWARDNGLQAAVSQEPGRTP
jgi:hypothetical protein